MWFNKRYSIVIILILNLWTNLVKCANAEQSKEIKNGILQFNSDNKCTTTKCINESAFYLNNMDLNIDPCNDFYEFASGGFLKKTLIPEEKFFMDQMRLLNKKVEDGLIKELKSEPQINDLEAYRKIKKFYVNCINETRIEKDGITPILQLLGRLGGWPVLSGDKWDGDNYQWENAVSLISEIGLLPDFPFQIDVIYYFDLKKYIINILEPTLLTKRGYNITDEYSKRYVNLMADIAVLLGAKNESAFNDMLECLKFEMQLSEAIYASRKNSSFIPTEKSIKDWTKEFPDIPWSSLLNRIFNPSNITITESDILYIENGHYVSTLAKLLNGTSKRTIANHQLWRIIINYAIKFMPREFRTKYDNFKEIISEKDIPLPRENDCLNILKQHSPVAINSLYIEKFVNKSGNTEALYMLENVKNQTKKYIERLELIDDEVLRKMAIEKIDTMMMFINYPAELLNNTKVEDFYEDTFVYLGNALYSFLNISRADKNFLLKTLRYARRGHDWARNLEVAKVNAFYDKINHRISVLAGILQSPFFDVDRPKYLNYGSLGFIIGHEINHGIHSDDAKRKHSIVLKNSTVEAYVKRVRCLMDQYSNYKISEVFGNVDGKLTFAESVADDGGFKVGYYAYNSWVKSTNVSEPLLPGLNYTAQQMYWIGIASTLCSKMKDVPLPDYISRDVHSPSEARINVGFSNVDEFAKDFNCPLGSRMNPVQKCAVW